MKESPPFKFGLGDQVKDMITGFTGIVNYRTNWLTGCNTYGIKSQALTDGKPQDSEHFDEQILVLIKADTLAINSGDNKDAELPGGPSKPIIETNRF